MWFAQRMLRHYLKETFIFVGALFFACLHDIHINLFVLTNHFPGNTCQIIAIEKVVIFRAADGQSFGNNGNYKLRAQMCGSNNLVMLGIFVICAFRCRCILCIFMHMHSLFIYWNWNIQSISMIYQRKIFMNDCTEQSVAPGTSNSLCSFWFRGSHFQWTIKGIDHSNFNT